MPLPEIRSQLNHEYYPNSAPATKSGGERKLEAVSNSAIPQSRLKKVTKIEKFIFSVFIVTFLCLAVTTIRMTTFINREEESISSLQTVQRQMQRDIETLDQEKNELQRTDRLKKIAEDAGMEMHEESIKAIK